MNIENTNNFIIFDYTKMNVMKTGIVFELRNFSNKIYMCNVYHFTCVLCIIWMNLKTDSQCLFLQESYTGNPLKSPVQGQKLMGNILN